MVLAKGMYGTKGRAVNTARPGAGAKRAAGAAGAVAPAASRSRGVTKGSIRRLARRGGCRRLGASVYEEAKQILKTFIGDVMRDARALLEVNQKRPKRTMQKEHILYALRKNGRTLYLQ